ncbi:MAG: DUF5615 family PIN-like protein [Candidatus Sulfotelmatobacter sp.]|jgi:uncharacterized protein DUF5615
MRFKLDENLPRELADDLVRLGHNTDTVHGEGLTGAEDTAVVHAARSSGRILMTLDKGIASLLQYPVNEHGGIVLFRPDASGRNRFYLSSAHGLGTCWKWNCQADWRSSVPLVFAFANRRAKTNSSPDS